MASIVFLRGVNVGGRKAFRPAAWAKGLSPLRVTNLGAAGTFVVHETIQQAKLRAEVLRRLPFKAEIMICRGRDLMDLTSADPFPRAASGKGVRRFVSVLAKRPRTIPRFPVDHPPGTGWQVEIVGIHGRFVLSLQRRTGKATVYPNEAVEKTLSVPATTRNWDTICKIRGILEGD